MRHRYMVIDQNVLREPELAELVNMQPWVRFVLPDLSFIEITKTTGSQESTYSRRFSHSPPCQNAGTHQPGNS
jgi:hypothetical protein